MTEQGKGTAAAFPDVLKGTHVGDAQDKEDHRQQARGCPRQPDHHDKTAKKQKQ